VGRKKPHRRLGVNNSSSGREVEERMVVKAEAVTNPRFGHPYDQRPIAELVRYGIVNVDKPSGPSSHEVTAWVKRILNVGHAGHGGTLEELVSREILS
jgi:H/ACA ribonucleoprotein complex subunit 4